MKQPGIFMETRLNFSVAILFLACVFESKTHAKNHHTVSLLRRIFPPLQIFDPYGVQKSTQSLLNLIN
jgi:hypothetical protein